MKSAAEKDCLSTVSLLRSRSSKRKQLLLQSLGVASADDLSRLLGTKEGIKVENEHGGLVAPSSSGSMEQRVNEADSEAFVVAKAQSVSEDADSVNSRKRKRTSSEHSSNSSSSGEKVMYDDYYKVLKEEEKIYKGSATFLKGTQSANPHNDYSQNFVDTGARPQNFIRDPGLNERFEEYPKLKELIELKDQVVTQTGTKPMYLRADLRTFRLKELSTRFDVIVIDPPLDEYRNNVGIADQEIWDWNMLEELDVGSVSSSRCFLWLWCGCSPEATTRGRQCLKRWGFRRCEDICWVKRNTRMLSQRRELEPEALFQRTKEHCLMGIKGTVRRSTDGDFIHANVDIDLIITEEFAAGDLRAKPEESFLIPEHFCLGRRRLHLFGRDDTLRPGWVTIGPELTSSNYDSKVYNAQFETPPYLTTGASDRIEQLRPKSPERGAPGLLKDKLKSIGNKASGKDKSTNNVIRRDWSTQGAKKSSSLRRCATRPSAENKRNIKDFATKRTAANGRQFKTADVKFIRRNQTVVRSRLNKTVSLKSRQTDRGRRLRMHQPLARARK